jgi:hypothetical protein
LPLPCRVIIALSTAKSGLQHLGFEITLSRLSLCRRNNKITAFRLSLIGEGIDFTDAIKTILTGDGKFARL